MNSKIKTAIQSAMTYRGLIAETITCDEFRIEFWHDSNCDSPYESDGMTPAIWLSADRFARPAEFGTIPSPFDCMSDGFISRNRLAIYKILSDEFDSSVEQFETDLKESRKDSGIPIQELRRDALQTMIDQIDKESWSGFTNYCETVCSLFRFAGIPADTFQRNGHCQGDSVYGLLIMTPEWVQSMGVPYARQGRFNREKCLADMELQADSYGAWCFGDCYGFTVSFNDGNEIDIADSCGGFIGDNPERNGMFDHLIPAIEYARRKRKTERFEKIKTLGLL